MQKLKTKYCVRFQKKALAVVWILNIRRVHLFVPFSWCYQNKTIFQGLRASCHAQYDEFQQYMVNHWVFFFLTFCKYEWTLSIVINVQCSESVYMCVYICLLGYLACWFLRMFGRFLFCMLSYKLLGTFAEAFLSLTQKAFCVRSPWMTCLWGVLWMKLFA